MFSIRIVTTDYYLCPPLLGFDPCISEFRGNEVKKVPVFRIYGSTPKGQKTCLHLHGVFPYLYVPHDGTPPVDHYLKQFATAIDKALNVSLGNGLSSTQHVYKISFVSGIPFYGYHHKEENFLKIYLYNPSMVKRVAELLLGGAVMNKVYQPHESHVPYSLQLFMDYNLYGMNMIDVAAVKFRRPKQDDVDTQEYRFLSAQSGEDPGFATFDLGHHKPELWTTDTIPGPMWMDEKVTRMSTCELEVDAVAADILNRLQIDGGSQSNPGLLALWDDERRRRGEEGMPVAESLETTSIQERRNVVATESAERWNERLAKIIPDLVQQAGLDRSMSDSLSLGSRRTDSRMDQSSISLDDSLLLSQTSKHDEEDAFLAEILETLQQERGPLSQSQRSMDSQGPLSQAPLSQGSQPLSQGSSQGRMNQSTLERSLSRAAVLDCIREYEESDSILASQSRAASREDEQKEGMEMSQCLWDINDDDLRELLESESFSGGGKSDDGVNLPQADGTNDESGPPRFGPPINHRPAHNQPAYQDRPLSTPSVTSEASVDAHWFPPQHAPPTDMPFSPPPANRRTSMLRLLTSDSNSPTEEMLAFEREMQNGNPMHSAAGNPPNPPGNQMYAQPFQNFSMIGQAHPANHQQPSSPANHYPSPHAMTANQMMPHPTSTNQMAAREMTSKYRAHVNRSVTSSLTVDVTGNPSGNEGMHPQTPDEWPNPLTPNSPWTDGEQRVPWMPPPPPWANNPRCQWSPLTPRSMSSNPQTPGTVTSPNSPWDPGSDWNPDKSPNQWGQETAGSPQVPDATQLQQRNGFGMSPMHNQKNSMISRVVVNNALKRQIPQKNVPVPEPSKPPMKKKDFFNPNPGQFDAWTAKPIRVAQKQSNSVDNSMQLDKNPRGERHNSEHENTTPSHHAEDIYDSACDTPMPPSVGSLVPEDDFYPSTPASVNNDKSGENGKTETMPSSMTPPYCGAKPSGLFRSKTNRPGKSPDRYSPDYIRWEWQKFPGQNNGKKNLGMTGKGRRSRENSRSPAYNPKSASPAYNPDFLSPRTAVFGTLNTDDLRTESIASEQKECRSKKDFMKKEVTPKETVKTQKSPKIPPKQSKIVVHSPRQVTVKEPILETKRVDEIPKESPKKFKSPKKVPKQKKVKESDSEASSGDEWRPTKKKVADEWKPTRKTSKTKSPKKTKKTVVTTETISNCREKNPLEEVERPASVVSQRRKHVQNSFNDLIEHLDDESNHEKPWFKSFSLMDSVPPSPASSEDLPDLPFVSSQSEKIDFSNLPKRPEIKVSIDLRKLHDDNLKKEAKRDPSSSRSDHFFDSNERSRHSSHSSSASSHLPPLTSQYDRKRYRQVFRPADVVWFACKPILSNTRGKVARHLNPKTQMGKKTIVKILASDKEHFDMDRMGSEVVKLERLSKSEIKKYRKMLKKRRSSVKLEAIRDSRPADSKAEWRPEVDRSRSPTRRKRSKERKEKRRVSVENEIASEIRDRRSDSSSRDSYQLITGQDTNSAPQPIKWQRSRESTDSQPIRRDSERSRDAMPQPIRRQSTDSQGSRRSRDSTRAIVGDGDYPGSRDPTPTPDRRERQRSRGSTPHPIRNEHLRSPDSTPQPIRKENQRSRDSTPQPTRNEPERSRDITPKPSKGESQRSCDSTPQPIRREYEPICDSPKRSERSRDPTPRPISRESHRSRNSTPSPIREQDGSDHSESPVPSPDGPDVYLDIASVGSAVSDSGPKLCVRLERLEDKFSDVFNTEKAEEQNVFCIDDNGEIKLKLDHDKLDQKCTKSDMKNLFDLLRNPTVSPNPSSRDSPVNQLSSLAKLYKDIAGKMNNVNERVANARALADLSEFSFDRGKFEAIKTEIDVERYCDEVMDHNLTYLDVMNVFALLSPVSDRSSSDTPPMPYSPEQMMNELDKSPPRIMDDPKYRKLKLYGPTGLETKFGMEGRDTKSSDEEKTRGEEGALAHSSPSYGAPSISDELPDLGPPLTAPVSPCSRSTSPPSLSEQEDDVRIADHDVSMDDVTEVAADDVMSEPEFRNVKSVESDLLKGSRLMESNELDDLVKEPEDIRSPLPCKIAGVVCRSDASSADRSSPEGTTKSKRRVYSITHSQSSRPMKSNRIAYKRFSIRPKSDDESEKSSSDEGNDFDDVIPRDDDVRKESSNQQQERREMAKPSPLEKKKKLAEEMSEKEKWKDSLKKKGNFKKQNEHRRKSAGPTLDTSQDALAAAIASISPDLDHIGCDSPLLSTDSEATIITADVQVAEKNDVCNVSGDDVISHGVDDVSSDDVNSEVGNVFSNSDDERVTLKRPDLYASDETTKDDVMECQPIGECDNDDVTDELSINDQADESRPIREQVKDSQPIIQKSQPVEELARDSRPIRKRAKDYHPKDDQANNSLPTREQTEDSRPIREQVKNSRPIRDRSSSPESMLGTPDTVRSRSPVRKAPALESYPYVFSVSDLSMATPAHMPDYARPDASAHKLDTLVSKPGATGPAQNVHEESDEEDDIQEALSRAYDSDSDDSEVRKGREELEVIPSHFSPRSKAAQEVRKQRLKRFLESQNQRTETDEILGEAERIAIIRKKAQMRRKQRLLDMFADKSPEAKQEAVSEENQTEKLDAVSKQKLKESNILHPSQELFDTTMECVIQTTDEVNDDVTNDVIPESGESGPKIDEADQGIDAVELSPQEAIQRQIDDTMEQLTQLSRSSGNVTPQINDVISPKNDVVRSPSKDERDVSSPIIDVPSPEPFVPEPRKVVSKKSEDENSSQGLFNIGALDKEKQQRFLSYEDICKSTKNRIPEDDKRSVASVKTKDSESSNSSSSSSEDWNLGPSLDKLKPENAAAPKEVEKLQITIPEPSPAALQIVTSPLESMTPPAFISPSPQMTSPNVSHMAMPSPKMTSAMTPSEMSPKVSPKSLENTMSSKAANVQVPMMSIQKQRSREEEVVEFQMPDDITATPKPFVPNEDEVMICEEVVVPQVTRTTQNQDSLMCQEQESSIPQNEESLVPQNQEALSTLSQEAPAPEGDPIQEPMTPMSLPPPTPQINPELGLDLLQAAINATELLVPPDPANEPPRDMTKENPLLFQLLEEGSETVRKSDDYRSPFGLEDLVQERNTGVRPKSSMEKVKEMQTLQNLKMEAQSPMVGVQLSLPETAGIEYPEMLDNEFGNVATVAMPASESTVAMTQGTIVPTVGVMPRDLAHAAMVRQRQAMMMQGTHPCAMGGPASASQMYPMQPGAVAMAGNGSSLVAMPPQAMAAMPVSHRQVGPVAAGVMRPGTLAVNCIPPVAMATGPIATNSMQQDYTFMDITDHIQTHPSPNRIMVQTQPPPLSPSHLSDHERFTQATNQNRAFPASANQQSEDEMRSLCLESSSNSSASPNNFVEIPPTMPFQPSIYKDMVNDSSADEAPSFDQSMNFNPNYLATPPATEQQPLITKQQQGQQQQRAGVARQQSQQQAPLTSQGHVTRLSAAETSPPVVEEGRLTVPATKVLTPVLEPPGRRKVRVELRRMGIANEKPAFSGTKPGQDSMRSIRAFESARRTEMKELHQWKAILAPSQPQRAKRSFVLTPLRLPPCYSSVDDWTMKCQGPDDFHAAKIPPQTKIPSQPQTPPEPPQQTILSQTLLRGQEKVVLECDSTTIRSDGESRSPMSDRSISDRMSEPSPTFRSGRGSPPSKSRRVEYGEVMTSQNGGRQESGAHAQQLSQQSTHAPTYQPVESDHLTVYSLEVLCSCRGEKKPDPENDPILAVAYSVLFGEERKQRNGRYADRVTGVVMVTTETQRQRERWSRDVKVRGLDVTLVESEKELLLTVEKEVKFHDPDILVGFEIQLASWGYVFERAKHLDMDMVSKLSRLPDQRSGSSGDREKDEYGADHMSEFKLAGRVVLNLWRVLRHEITLNIYTFENACQHVLHRRVPVYSCRHLADWFLGLGLPDRWRAVEYVSTRAKGCIELIESLDLLGQTSEFARVFGIEFYHVLSRGTQYRVESMLMRMTKNQNYICVSPGVMQRARQEATECIPLTLEPESCIYTEPVVVLDFQSLYPSIMIAYNYCYSTCLGKVNKIETLGDGPYGFGCTSLDIDPAQLKKFEKDRAYTISPVGAVFVKSRVRKGVVPRMLEDILNTRFMVKKSMKRYKADKRLSRILHARQLGLKLIANTTYGYTAANFSGRMPCMEVGDSVVSKARETLERAIAMVNQHDEWDARVVYGDTDSLFIHLPGRTKDEAFKLGQEMCDAITESNPSPIKLKFEKVYLPCVLQTKKRYAGYMYETPEQQEPVLDCKGIETVRRDNCPVVSKTLEQSLKCLFSTRDVAQVKSLVQKVCLQLLEGKTSLQMLTFAKEYRGLHGYSQAACVPALEIARKRLTVDRRSEPRVGERVPYVIVYGGSGVPLIQLVRQPMEVLRDRTLRPNAVYYIMKQILPPLDRVLSIIGMDVFSWFHELPRMSRVTTLFRHQEDMAPSSRQGVLPMYFAAKKCVVCEEQCSDTLCERCNNDPQATAVRLSNDIRQCEMELQELKEICYNCTGRRTPSIDCISLDCPVLYKVNAAKRTNADIQHKYTLHAQLLL